MTQLQLSVVPKLEFTGSSCNFLPRRCYREYQLPPISQLTFTFARKLISSTKASKQADILYSTDHIYLNISKSPIPREEILEDVKALNLNGFKVGLIESKKLRRPLVAVNKINPGNLWIDPKINPHTPNEAQMRILLMLEMTPKYGENYKDAQKIGRIRTELWRRYRQAGKV